MSNITIIGHYFVGKTAIIRAFTNPDLPFDLKYEPTLGTSMSKIEYQGSTYLLWDTAGQEKYASLAPTYFRNSNAAIIVYDVTSRQSFEAAETWLSRYLDIVKVDNPIIIAANKIDLTEDVQVTAEEGRAFAESHNFSFVEVSAKTGEHLEDIVKILHEKLPPPPPKKEKPIEFHQNDTHCC